MAAAAARLPGRPATVVTARGTLRLVLVAALQHLPARQRAVLILRDVPDWRAPEVASLLGTSTAAVKSSPQCARARLDEVAPDEDLLVEPEGAADRDVLDRYMAAFESADMEALIGLRMLPACVNGHPAVVMYARGVDGVLRAHPVRVLTVVEGAVARITAFPDAGLPGRFGMPEVLS